MHSQRVILNEVVSMVCAHFLVAFSVAHKNRRSKNRSLFSPLFFTLQQRVILFLSCLMGPADRLSGRNRSRFEIVPLLTHLHPRQELLKVIYNHLLEAFKKTDANIAPARNNHNHKNHLSSESRANKSLVKSHESSAPSSSLNPQTDTYHLFC